MTLLLLVGFVVSCATESPNGNFLHKEYLISLQTYTYKGNSFTYGSLTPAFLEDRHGLDSRYFTDSAGLFPPRRPCIVQFNVDISDNTELTLLYKNSFLTDAYGNSYPSQTRESYFDLWKEKTAASLLAKLNWLFDHNIHKEARTIPAAGRSEGYFVFLLNRPRQGEFLLTVPVVINGNEGTLSLPLTLDLDRIEPGSTPVTNGPAFIPQDN